VNFSKVVSALLYLHKNGIVHRDIKPQNIFVREDSSLAVGDFGLSRLPSSSKELADVILGTPQYMAPEVVNGNPSYTTKSDIWATGVMFFEISALKPPFSAFNMPVNIYCC
jgi:NIMA (never in mitosis gene a)-related kinase